MSINTVVPLRQPDEIDDPLTAILRSGARRLLTQAIEAEAEAFLAAMKAERLPDGRERVVRHGHGPERQVQTGIGPVAVQRPKLRDRAVHEAGADRIRFTSAILPRWARRTRSLDALLPVLYLRGVSMGDFQEALGALLGKDAPNLSPSVIARLRGEWEAGLRALATARPVGSAVCLRLGDGVYLQARMEPQAECMLVLIGATPEGKKELLGFQVGVRESTQSWRELLVDLKARGLAIVPELATGDGALGFWKALDAVSPTTPASALYGAQDRQRARQNAQIRPAGGKVRPARGLGGAGPCDGRSGGRDVCREVWRPSTRRRSPAWSKDRDALLTFCDFPAEHRDHLRTSNPIGSVFATVRHRTRPHQGRTVARHRPAHGVQAGHGSGQDLAPAEGREPVAQGRRGCHIPQRRRGHQHASTERRLITASPKFQHSSGCCCRSRICRSPSGRGQAPGRRASECGTRRTTCRSSPSVGWCRR